jgi:RNA polymerase sigma-70 factor, ECF subfamily
MLRFFCSINSKFRSVMFLLQPADGDRCGHVPYTELLELGDELLMQELQAGNTDAFAIVFKRYHRLVHATALHILRDAHEAEDLTQSVFLETYRRAAQFDARRGTLKVWLLQYAYSRSINRRNYLLVRHFYNQTEVDAADEEASLWSPSRLQFQEASQLANEALDALPDVQRKTIEMFFFEGLSFKEIAKQRNESLSSVRHHYYRGLERLRSYLESCPQSEQHVKQLSLERGTAS